MKAIKEFQRKALDPSTDIVELVNNAYAIAYKLGLQDFANWCNAELDGYYNHPNVPFPEYRCLDGKAVAKYSTGKLRLLRFEDIYRARLSSVMYYNKGIGCVISLIENNNFMHLSFSSGIEQDLIASCHDSDLILSIFFRVHTSELKNIFSMIKKTILAWALRCEKQGILGEEWIFTKEEKQLAQNINYNIGSVQNMANHNTDTTVNQTAQSMTITKGDFKTLAEFLSSKGMNEPEIQELKEIIETESYISEDGIKNSKIQQWLGKIAVGGGLVAQGVTVEMIVGAIKQYFGF